MKKISIYILTGTFICCSPLIKSNLILKKIPVTNLMSDNDTTNGYLIQLKIPSEKTIKNEFYSGFQSGIIFNDESVIAISMTYHKNYDSQNGFSLGKDEFNQIIEDAEPIISGFKSNSDFYYYLNDSMKLNKERYYGVKNYSSVVVAYLNVKKNDVKMFNEIINNIRIEK